MMGRVLIGVLWVVLCATSVSAGSSEQEARSALEKGDYARVVALTRPFAEQGEAWAQTTLAWMYDMGKGMPEDKKEAVTWYRKAAKQGNATAQFNLGTMYARGRGVSQDYKEAVAWYRKAAVQRHTDAQFNLGLMYLDGNGMLKNSKEAGAWFHKAAAQGDAWAHLHLGRMYHDGKGVPRDRVHAYMWLSHADAGVVHRKTKDHPDEIADDMKVLERDLTTEEIDKAQNLAQRCQDTKFKQCG